MELVARKADLVRELQFGQQIVERGSTLAFEEGWHWKMFINGTGGRRIDISGAKLVMTDIQASNGIIHVIDRVMIP